MEQEEITSLAHHVYEFKEALKRLTNVFIMSQENKEMCSTVHENLSDVLRILKKLLENYPGLQSTDVLIKTQNLIKHVQNNGDSKHIYDFINQLAVAFSIRVSEYIVGGDADANILQIRADDTPQTTAGEYNQRQGQHMTTFGVDLEQQLKASGTTIPHIVNKCIQEIDERGILVKMAMTDTTMVFEEAEEDDFYHCRCPNFGIKGIYRVSGVKSKVEKLCQEFETDGEKVELSGVHPNVIANVLKLYLRQLPQPLFTNQLYSEFVRFAKCWPCGSNKDMGPSEAVEELRSILVKLPKDNYNTVRVIIHHLNRISKKDHVNNMSPGNLGIVFGPTLLRTTEGHSSINSLLDTIHQSRAIELIIMWAYVLFPP